MDIVKVQLYYKAESGEGKTTSYQYQWTELVDWLFGKCGRLDDQSYDPEINLSTGHSAKVNSFLLHVE